MPGQAAGYSELQLSALQEAANIGTGTAATALSSLVGAAVEIAVPRAELVTLGEASGRIGDAETPAVAVLTRLVGDVPASVLLVLPQRAAESLCALLGTDAESALGLSALQEIGNILSSSYGCAVAQLAGLSVEPEPPLVARDMLGALVDSVVATAAVAADSVLFLQTSLGIASVDCDFGFLWIPAEGSVGALLGALGL